MFLCLLISFFRFNNNFDNQNYKFDQWHYMDGMWKCIKDERWQIPFCNYKTKTNSWNIVHIGGGGRVGSDVLSANAGRVGSTFRRVGSKKSDPWSTGHFLSHMHGLTQSLFTLPLYTTLHKLNRSAQIGMFGWSSCSVCSILATPRAVNNSMRWQIKNYIIWIYLWSRNVVMYFDILTSLYFSRWRLIWSPKNTLLT